jgi:hypothetical protein
MVCGISVSERFGLGWWWLWCAGSVCGSVWVINTAEWAQSRWKTKESKNKCMVSSTYNVTLAPEIHT